MCYGQLDPKYAMRDADMRLGALADDVRTEKAWWMRLPAALARMAAAFARVGGPRPAGKEARP